MTDLTKAEISRYSRHLRLSSVGPEGQQKLKAAKVLVIGAGGLGSPALLYLAAAGVGRLGLVDGDVVDASNLQRQVLYGDAQVGQPKVLAAAQRLRDLNPLIEIVPIQDFLRIDNALAILESWDVIIDGSDNFETRYLVNDACVILNKPLVYGALHQFSGQLSVFNYQGGPSYRCLFPEPPDADSIPNCSEAGVLGVLPGLIGTMQATEAIKMILGLGDVASGVLCLWDSLELSLRKIKFRRNEAHFLITELRAQELSCTRTEQLELSVNDLETWCEEGRKFQLLDVREPWEREICKLTNSLSYDPDYPLRGLRVDEDLVLYCHKGSRSARLVSTFREMGFAKVWNLVGGIDRWALEIDPDLERY